jgi:hypothetical protein
MRVGEPTDRRVLPHINGGANRALTVDKVREREAAHTQVSGFKTYTAVNEPGIQMNWLETSRKAHTSPIFDI